MKWGKKLIGVGVAVVLGLSLILIPVGSRFSPAQAAVTWTKYPGEVTLEGERYVGDAWVIKDGDTYKMWYTRGKTDLGITGIIDGLAALGFGKIIDAIAVLDLASLLTHIGGLDATALRDFIDATSTVIGYAKSADGKTWTVQKSEVVGLTGSSAAWDSVGAPSVIKDGAIYKMWYTHTKTDLTVAELETLLTAIADRDTDAILGLLDATSTVIGYAESTDGRIWTAVEPYALVVSGSVWDSVGAPSVIKDGPIYRMWYTHGTTDFTKADLDAILAAGNFTIDDLLDILDGTSTVIGYATSADGITWAVQKSEVTGLAATNAAWDSVGTPAVIKDGATYKMWYTRGEMDFNKAKLQALLDEIKALRLGEFVDALAALNLWDLLVYIARLDLTAIRTLLADTSCVISYATSGDGKVWTVRDPQHLVGISLTPWSSVGNPSVIKDDTIYRMWYSQGIPRLTVWNLFNLLAGITSSIGYAYYVPPVVPRVVVPPVVPPPPVIVVPPVVPPVPAEFVVSNLVISPIEVSVGEPVTISVRVTNIGEVEGSYTVTLKVNQVVEATKEVAIAGGTETTVTFTTVKDVVGTYAVNVDGLAGTFVVKAPPVIPPPPINWWLMGGIIAAVIIIGLIIRRVIVRRRA